MLFDTTGVHVVGCIKEGGWLFETKALFFAWPIDEVMTAAGL